MIDAAVSFLDNLDGYGRFLAIWSLQYALLLGVAGLAVKRERRERPAVRFNLWLAGLVAGAVLPVLGSLAAAVPLPQPPGAGIVQWIRPSHVEPAAAVIPERSGAAPVLPAARVETFVAVTAPAAANPSVWAIGFALWAAGCAVLGVRALLAYRRMSRIRRRSIAAEAPASGGAVPIRYSREVTSPLLSGVFRPVILLPADLARWTTASERDAIVAHELAHALRRDHYVNLLQTLLGVVFFFHPAVRYALRQMCCERELACDQRVLKAGGRPEVYAGAILKVVERNIGRSPAHHPAFSSSKKILERRVDMILHDRRPSPKTGVRRYAAAMRAAAALGFAVWLMLPPGPLMGGQDTQAVVPTAPPETSAAASEVAPAVASEAPSAIAPSPSAGVSAPASPAAAVEPQPQAAAGEEAHLEYREYSGRQFPIYVFPDGRTCFSVFGDVKADGTPFTAADCARPVAAPASPDDVPAPSAAPPSQAAPDSAGVFRYFAGGALFGLRAGEELPDSAGVFRYFAGWNPAQPPQEGVFRVGGGVQVPPPPPPALAGVPACPPAPEAQLCGFVFDSTLARVPGVSVRIFDGNLLQTAPATALVGAVISNEAGTFRFTGLRPGPYRLEAELPGFLLFQDDVLLAPGDNRQHTIVLNLGPISQSVEVSVRRPDSVVPPPAAAPERIRIGGSVTAATLVRRADPEYPAQLRNAGIEGTVRIQGVIGVDGRLASLTVLNADIHPGLAQAALDAVRQWTYLPGRLNGVPAALWTTITVAFKLSD